MGYGRLQEADTMLPLPHAQSVTAKRGLIKVKLDCGLSVSRRVAYLQVTEFKIPAIRPQFPPVEIFPDIDRRDTIQRRIVGTNDVLINFVAKDFEISTGPPFVVDEYFSFAATTETSQEFRLWHMQFEGPGGIS